jgi:DNA polymerase IIIc chi subunit
MSGTAEFRLLAETSDWLAETLAIIYRDVEQRGKVAVLCADKSRLYAISEALWANANERFVTYDFAHEAKQPQVNVLLAEEVRFIRHVPTLINLTYLLDNDDMVFRQVTEIVLADPVTVDKARRQYKMYRSYGYRIDHIQLS